MSKLQWFSIFVLGLTALGVSYFYNAVPVAPSALPTPTVTEEVETPVEVPEVKPADPKAACGNNICTPPENATLCPADCQ
jgi:hypothetical protein